MPPIPSTSAKETLIKALTGWGMSWGGWLDNRLGEWWLLAQLVLISAHLLPAWPSPATLKINWPASAQIAGLAIFLIGSLLALQAFWGLGQSLSPLPEPKQGCRLVISGPYQRCRHPLYQGLLLCSLAVVLVQGSLLHLGLFLALCVLLSGKAKREEAKLCDLFPAYNEYRAKTAAIIPGFPLLDWRH